MDETKLRKARDEYFDAYFSNGKVPAATMAEKAKNYIEALEWDNHATACALAQHTLIDWPRIRNLPKEEQEPFKKWLDGQTRPLISTLAYEEQDAYYSWDYNKWKGIQGGALKDDHTTWD